MIAHIRRTDKAQQPLKDHCLSVSRLCARAAEPLGLTETAALIGLLHDMGKATAAFRSYLIESAKEDCSPPSPHFHAPTGAIYVFRRWFREQKNARMRLAAQILILCIHGHHTGLTDCLDTQGESALLNAMKQDETGLCYEEAENWFLSHVVSKAALDAKFAAACDEIRGFVSERVQKQKDVAMRDFQLGMLTRLLLSILVDADRWDSACFEFGQDASEQPPDPDWTSLLNTFEVFRKEKLHGSDSLARIRSEVSEQCAAHADLPSGIFTLCVPTGGGQTYSSLRYALRHAALYGKRRVFYIIPYNTILDQNAQDIRRALADYPSILEHHSNVVFPAENEQAENDREAYRRLTERWDSDIVLTSLVQFLNACFAAPNTDARRLYRLANAVLIFDEIQSLPNHCKTLFERAITFLSACCGSTVVLCTATQPKLSLVPEPVPLIDDSGTLGQRLKRVEYVPQLETSVSNAEAAGRLANMLFERSVLAIVNTKATAWQVFAETVRLMEESGLCPVLPDASFSEERIGRAAEESTGREVLCIHLSTLLCPAHRKALLRWIQLWLNKKKRVLCVSTALIEAGINVSFPVVVRSLAGLPSIVQAAGRANRNMEYDTGTVYIWDFNEEKLTRLPDIRNGGNAARSMFAEESSEAPDSPAQIARFYSLASYYTDACRDYPLPTPGITLTGLLSDNPVCSRAAANFKSKKDLVLHQSFRTAYRAFEVIPQATTSVLVPFAEGKIIIERLNGKHDMKEEVYLLHRAQAYSVALFESSFRRLVDENAVRAIGNTGVYALEPGYYGSTEGVKLERQELEEMIL